MSEQRSCLENLCNEVFYLIFNYLAPHHLLRSFKKLNKRFTMLLNQQPFYLPSNRHMNYELYLDYLTKIIPKYSSQFVHLHLSERRAPDAVEWFVSEVSLDKAKWSKLQAVTIEDIPLPVLGQLLDDNSFLFNINSLSFDIGHDRYHHFQYETLTDFNFVMAFLDTYPKLHSLYLRIGHRVFRNYSSSFNQHCRQIKTYHNLQILTIDECSRILLVKLLSDGHVPRLRRLKVNITCASADLGIEPPDPIPLQQAFVPELRYVSIELSVGVTWVLIFLEDLQRHSQLEQLKLSGAIKAGGKDSLPRVAFLRQWLALTQLKTFTFQMEFGLYFMPNDEKRSDALYKEYCQATGIESTASYEQVNFHYPEMSLSYPSKSNVKRLKNRLDVANEPVNEGCQVMTIIDLDYVEDEILEQQQAVACWHYLRKINLEKDFPDDDDVVGENIVHFLHIAKRSPNFRELYVELDIDYGRALSSNVELGRLLSAQLETLYFKAQDADCSLKDLVQIVIKLFSHSKSTPRLKQLTLNVDGHPTSWLSTEHLVRWIKKVFKRFPKLIHFTLYCQHGDILKNFPNNLSQLAPAWYVMTLLSQPNRNSSLTYRHKPYSLDVWL